MSVGRQQEYRLRVPPCLQDQRPWLDLSRGSAWVGMRMGTGRRRKEAGRRQSFYGVSDGKEFACPPQVPSSGNGTESGVSVARC